MKTHIAILMLATFSVVLSTSLAWADDEVAPMRVVLVDVPGGGTELIEEVMADIALDFDVRSQDWFADQAKQRAFNAAEIIDKPSDLVWVMDGSNIDLIIDVKEQSAEDYQVRFIVADGAETEREFFADRGHSGSLRRGGAMIIRFQLEDFLDARPNLAASVVDDEQPDETSDEDEEADISDPQAMRERAAQDREDLMEHYSRDWVWVRVHGRWFQKDFSVASRDAVFTFRSGGFPGFELDVEAFPLGMSNPDMVEAGFYLTYNHGVQSLNLHTEGEQSAAQSVSVHNLTVEGGALYRLDTPLDESNRQLRFKIGGRYEAFSITDNASIPSTAKAGLVLGTRLVLPVMLDEFAVTAGLDIVPAAAFLEGSQFFGADSFTYGFGSELGILYEVFDNGFMSAGYSFRVMRTEFTGDGDPLGEEGNPVVFADSEAFDLNQGLRAGFVYQY